MTLYGSPRTMYTAITWNATATPGYTRPSWIASPSSIQDECAAICAMQGQQLELCHAVQYPVQPGNTMQEGKRAVRRLQAKSCRFWRRLVRQQDSQHTQAAALGSPERTWEGGDIEAMA